MQHTVKELRDTFSGWHPVPHQLSLTPDLKPVEFRVICNMISHVTMTPDWTHRACRIALETGLHRETVGIALMGLTRKGYVVRKVLPNFEVQWVLTRYAFTNMGSWNPDRSEIPTPPVGKTDTTL